MNLKVAVFLDLQAVAGWSEVVEAARGLAGSGGSTRWTKDRGFGADYVGEDVDGGVSVGGDGMPAVVGVGSGRKRSVVVRDLVNDANAGLPTLDSTRLLARAALRRAAARKAAATRTRRTR